MGIACILSVAAYARACSLWPDNMNKTIVLCARREGGATGGSARLGSGSPTVAVLVAIQTWDGLRVYDFKIHLHTVHDTAVPS